MTCFCDGNPERTRLHDAIRDEVAVMLQQAGLRGVKTEQDIGGPDSGRRNDVQVAVWNETGGPLWLDVVTADATADEFVTAAGHVLGLAAAAKERFKETSYAALLAGAEPRPTFVPLAWELGGTWGDKAVRFFREVARRRGGTASAREGWFRYWMFRFSVVFVKALVGYRSLRLRRIRGDVSDAQRQVDAELYGVGDPSIDASPENLRHGL